MYKLYKVECNRFTWKIENKIFLGQEENVMELFASLTRMLGNHSLIISYQSELNLIIGNLGVNTFCIEYVGKNGSL